MSKKGGSGRVPPPAPADDPPPQGGTAPAHAVPPPPPTPHALPPAGPRRDPPGGGKRPTKHQGPPSKIGALDRNEVPKSLGTIAIESIPTGSSSLSLSIAPRRDSLTAQVNIDQKAIERAQHRFSSAPPPMGKIVLPRDEPLGRIGRYDILGRLASGGMAEIFLAREVSPGGSSRMVVVKLIKSVVAGDQDFQRMFVREARVIMGLTHPHICHAYEFGEDAAHFYIAMEWVSGISLARVIREVHRTGERLPYPVVAKIFSQLAEALDYAHKARDEEGHSLGLVHRDVSPHNIIISHGGIVKLLDFGVATLTNQGEPSKAGVAVGKLAYMAPEQVKGRGVDRRTDVFALGICLYETLTGERLYKRAHGNESLAAILGDPLPSFAEAGGTVPLALEEIVHRALAKDPDLRYQSAAQMQEALDTYIASTGEVVSSQSISRVVRTRFAEVLEEGVTLTDDVALPSRNPAGNGAVPSVPVPARISKAWIAAATALILGAVAWVTWGPGSAPPNNPNRAPAMDAFSGGGQGTPAPKFAPAATAPPAAEVPDAGREDGSASTDQTKTGSTKPVPKRKPRRTRSKEGLLRDPGF
ncbi:MAG: serine/threonine protein kinase [Myxococcales bacterium]|nr:serine/threonine protein kinase [Myxococcales bacterium]